MDSQLLLAAASTAAIYGTYKVITFFARPYFSPIYDLPGPTSRNVLFGNLEEIRKAEGAEVHERWVGQYGKTFKYKAVFNTDRIFTMDLRAINHIFTHSMDYQKPTQARFNLGRILGDGILITEGEKHRQQRRVMNPSFGPSSIRDLTSVFFRKAIQLRDIWQSELFKTQDTQRIEVLSWLSRTTLDVIGLAGFNYRFNALTVDDKPNELSQAFSTLFHSDNQFHLLPFLKAFIPIFRFIPTERDRETSRAQKTMRRIGEKLVSERKRELLGLDVEKDEDEGDQGLRGQDLLTALMRANMDTEVPASQRMSDEDVLAQVPTFFVAGHETTSTETMWCLHALSNQPETQQKLRAELLSVATDTPSMDELNALPYLDAVVRETLRLYAAVPQTIRVAMKDDVLPLSEPVTDRRGNVRHEIKITKGDSFFIPIMVIHRSESIWGKDALEFKPERWENLPEAVHAIPGVMSGLLTFLGGARGCIGYRFALVEMKALLFTLIRAFEFAPAVPASDIQRRSLIVQRPYLRSQKDAGSQMPLIVRRVASERTLSY